MATGINYDDPEVIKGFELFEQLFADRRYPVESPTPTTLEGSSLEDEPTPEMEPSPEVERSPEPPKRRYRVTPPRWLWTSLDQTPPPPTPPSDEDIESESEDFSPEPVPPRERTPEPPLPELKQQWGVVYTSFDKALNRMHWELEKYKEDKQHIVKFIELAPLVRDAQILREELVTLGKLYAPEDTKNKDPVLVLYLLENYMKQKESELRKRYQDIVNYYEYPDIREDILAAEYRIHKQKAIDAISSYKRLFFVLQKEVEINSEKLAKHQQHRDAHYAEMKVYDTEIQRLKAEEAAAENEYQWRMIRLHEEACAYQEQYTALAARVMELRKRLLPEAKTKLKSLVEQHDEEVKEMSLWLSLFPPRFELRIRQLLQGYLTTKGYKPVPMDEYLELVGWLEADLQHMLYKRQMDLDQETGEWEAEKNLLDQKMAKLDEWQKPMEEILAKKNALAAELRNIRTESAKLYQQSHEFQLEKLYLEDYNAMLLEKIMAVQADLFLRSFESPATAGPSPGPVDKTFTKNAIASPPSFRSEMFDIGQIASAPEFGESPGLLDDERPTSGISDLSASGGLATDQAVSDVSNLNDESLPSYLSRSGDSPADQGLDNLDDERPPLEMMNISGLSGSGGPTTTEAIDQGLDPYENIEDEPSPFHMVNLSDLSGSGGSIAQSQTESPLLNISGLKRGASFFDSLDGSNASTMSKTISVSSPGKKDRLQLNVELIPQEIRRSPSGRRVVCDVSVLLQEADFRIPDTRRALERRYKVVRGTPPASQTVGRNVDRRYGMFTPQSAFKRQYVSLRRPLFHGDFESPGSPYGSGRTTHPELMNLPEHPSGPRPLDTTMEWENPEMNPELRK